MSSCLIISQDNNIFIGSDTACSLKVNNQYYRISNTMRKLFCIDNSILFCSGRKSCVDDFMMQVNKNGLNIDFLSEYLNIKYPYKQSGDSFDLEIAIVDYDNYTVTQLSQYNNFQKIVYPKSKDVQIIACGYNTSKTFELAKKGVLSNMPIYDLFLYVFKEISNEYIGGYLDFYSSINNHFIKEISKRELFNICGDLLLLTSDFVTSGVVTGCQFIAGKIYSSPDTLANNRFSYFNLDDGTFSWAGGKIKYDGETLLLSDVNLKWEDIEGANDYVTTITKNTVTTEYVNALNIVAGSVDAINITGEQFIGKTFIVGGEDNGDGSIIVKDKDGNIIATIGVDGIIVKDGSFGYMATDEFVVLSGSVLSSGVTQNGFTIKNSSLYSECKSQAQNNTAPSDSTTRNVTIDNIDLTGYSTMTITSVAQTANHQGVCYVEYGIDSIEGIFWELSNGSETEKRTFTMTVDISAYEGTHTLKFHQHAQSNSSYSGYQSIADLGLTSIVLTV